MANDMAESLLQRIDEVERDGFASLAQVVSNSLDHIPVGLLT